MFGLTTKTSAPETPQPLPATPALVAIFTTMEEANAARRELTRALCDAATQGDAVTVEALQARYNALPLLICGLVIRLAQERVQAWQAAVGRVQQQHGDAHAQEQAAWSAYREVETQKLLPSTEDAFTTAERASIRTSALQDTRQKIETGYRAAQEMTRLAHDALTRAVSNPNAGLEAADGVLRKLEEQRPLFVQLTPAPRPEAVTLSPLFSTVPRA